MSGRVGPGRGFHALLVVIGLMLAAVPPCGAQRERADLYLRLNRRGAADVALVLGFAPPSVAAATKRLEQALSGRLERVEPPAEENGWVLTARCPDAFRRQGAGVAGEVDPAPLTEWLRTLGVPWLTINVSHPAAGFTRVVGAQPVKDGDQEPNTVSYFAAVPAYGTSEPVRFEFGYRPRQLWRRVIPLGLLLLLPLALTLVMRRSALRAPEADRVAVWFRYWRFLRFLGLAAVPVWMIAAYLLGLAELVEYTLGGSATGPGIPIWFALFVLPPLLVTVACNLLSQPVFQRVRGMEWTAGELARQSAGTLVRILVPVMFLLAGIDALEQSQVRTGIAYFAAAIVGSIICGAWGRRLHGMTPTALTAGELRDRVFALAEKAGVKVQQVYVLPGGKSRVANAFAMQGNNVLFTDYLLQHMSRREVDAIVAHELTHLQRRDPFKLMAAFVGGGILGVAVATTLELLRVTASDQFGAMIAGALGFGVLLTYFFARRFERAADAGAVALTGDPEALITGLAKLMQLNLLPMEWGKWDERFLTHPSTLRRVQAIATQSGIPAERLPELVSHSEASDERYALPSAVTAQERVFSTSFKSETLHRISWSLTAVMVLTPALVAAALRPAHLEPGARWAAGLLGLALTLSLYLAVANVAPLWGYIDLRRRLRAQLEAEGLQPEAWGGAFAGFAPAAAPRLYESYGDWDVGYLLIAGDRLAYVGEQTRFALRREQVTDVRLGAAGPGWWRAARVYVTWRDDESASGGTFNLRLADVRSMRQLARASQALCKRLQAWREQAPAGELPAPLAGLAPPELSEVTSTSPRALVSARAFIQSLLFTGLLTAGAAVLLDLPFDPPAGEAWYAVGAALVAAVFQWVPLWRYREPAVQSVSERAAVVD